MDGGVWRRNIGKQNGGGVWTIGKQGKIVDGGGVWRRNIKVWKEMGGGGIWRRNIGKQGKIVDGGGSGDET